METEELARKLHEWYLEATEKLNEGSYNNDAQKDYDELTEDQKSIDRYIAKKIKQEFSSALLKNFGG